MSKLKKRLELLKRKINDIIVEPTAPSSTIVKMVTSTGREIEIETDYPIDQKDFFFSPGEIITPNNKIHFCVGIGLNAHGTKKETWFLREGDEGITHLS